MMLIGMTYIINIYSVIKAKGLFDFGSFYASGQLSRQGENPYSLDSEYINKVSFPEIGIEGFAPNLNPPISVLLFRPFSRLEPQFALLLWRVVTVGLIVTSIMILNHIYPAHGSASIIRLIWAFSLAGLWHTIRLGQIYGVLLLLTVLIYLSLQHNRPVAAGILLGIMIALKPNFVFWAFLLLLTGNWMSCIWSGIIAVIISLIPGLTNGFEIYRKWLVTTRLYTTPDLLLFPGNSSLQGLTSRFGSSMAGIVLGVLLCILMAYFVKKHRLSQIQSSSLGIIISLLISPIAWAGYTMLTLPLFFKTQKWNWLLRIAAGILSVPFIFVVSFFSNSGFNFVFWGWLYGWALLLILIGFWVDSRPEKPIALTDPVRD